VVSAAVNDEAAFRKWLSENVHIMRGVPGCVRLDAAIEPASNQARSRAVIVRIWKDRASYVAAHVSPESRARYKLLVASLGQAVEPNWTTAVSTLIDA